MKTLKYVSIFTVLTLTIATSAFFISPQFRHSIRGTSTYWYATDKLAMPIMHRLDPEEAHHLTVRLLKNNYAPVAKKSDPKILNISTMGMKFSNPIGIAAGLDKQAQAMQGLLDLGFGFVEVGGVTPEPQIGNPKPRIFRLPEDNAIINRYGLNSDGQIVISARLAEFKANSNGIVGVNIAKNTTSTDMIGDYQKGVRNLGGNVDFIVLNVSCPNVAWTKELSKDGDELANMVCAVRAERDNLPNSTVPLLMKLAPDMDDSTKQHMADIAIHCGVDGLIVSNTTVGRSADLRSPHSKEIGGLSGRPLKQAALQSVRDMYRLTQGKIPIIGVGGIESGQDAYERIRSGASLVQIYTAMVYQGPGILPKIKAELAKLLERDGFNSVAEAVGIDVNMQS